MTIVSLSINMISLIDFRKLIKHLIENDSFDYKSFFKNESPEEFNAFKPMTTPPSLYGPPNYVPSPPITYGPPKFHNNDFNSFVPNINPGFEQLTPPAPVIQNYSKTYDNNFFRQIYTQRPIKQNYYEESINNNYPTRSQYYSSNNNYNAPQLSPDQWYTRYIRSNKLHGGRNRRSSSTNSNSNLDKFIDIVYFKDDANDNFDDQLNSTRRILNNNLRKKRQTTGQLCNTRSEFISPKAALNNQGNWMYVVNLQEVDPNLTQYVKSETCVSQQCNGLCSIPFGYSARCEQKFAQKRLVALQPNGQKLFNDVFWFPSCCICSITRNNQ